ncbi:LLM class flavin-dependent oxidoreductase [Effusibacillus dendaii]|uniref:Monooxygenase n=1 Tax=Effusibacillus dendaii TaxID=2743772 RepID=A0A7I8DKU1_9BACL|nr:LLM class flavin-dependent oxidoreductase [Effusibacillus dendaii]BCJ88541.1 monooxygenase [Effusibacillus dendaii]
MLELGLFLMPSHPPERSLYEGTEWDLQVIRWADELGYKEAWIGEHFTSPWEPIPAPDLLIAQAIKQTKQIKLAPGAHLLPYHNPVELAHRVAYLDHLAQGRLMLGIGSGGLPSDWQLYDVDGMNGENRRMTAEALDIMLKVWTEQAPFEYRGNYWKFNMIEPMFDLLKHHIFPYQKPYPPIGIAGLSPGSETLKMAGERGFIPMSLGGNDDYIASHWIAVLEGAARSGLTPERTEWRITRDVFVAETDEEAIRYSVGADMGRQHREYWLPLFANLGAISVFKHDPNVPDEEVTAEYMAETSWLVGSPETVAKKLQTLYDKTGGFGTLLVTGYDYCENPEAWQKSLRLLKEEVVPRLRT